MPVDIPFDPYTPLFGDPDLNTIVGRWWPVRLEAGEPRLFATEAGVQVLGHCHGRSQRAPLMILVHGLEGSSSSNYMRWMAAAGLAARHADGKAGGIDGEIG